MKKLMCLVLCVALCLSGMAIAENVGGEASAEQKLTNLMPVFECLMSTMGIEGEVAYDPENPEFFWEQMLNVCRTLGMDDEMVMTEDDKLCFSDEVMADFVAASFAGVESCPEVPEQYGFIAHDDEKQAWTMEMMAYLTMKVNYLVLEAYTENEAGDMQCLVGLYSLENDERLGGLVIDVVANAGNDAVPYGVCNAVVDTEGGLSGENATLCAVIYGKPEVEVEEPETTEETTVEVTPEPAATPAPEAETVIYGTLAQGDRGEAVQKMQERLLELGYDTGDADGVYGDNTIEAVRYFQNALGLSQTGVATSALQEKLFADDAPEFVPYVQQMEGMTGIRIEKMQDRLRELGYTGDETDGFYGPRTAKAVKLFQKTAEIAVDGIAGVVTLELLFSDDAPRYVYIGGENTPTPTMSFEPL